MDLAKPRPHPTPTTEPFWSALDREQLQLQRCADCGSWVYYPRVRCPNCLSAELVWEPVGGDGRVYTFTVARQPTAPAFAADVPQLLAVVELDIGVRMSTTLVGVDPAEVHIGLAVRPVFDHGPDGVTMLRFTPA